MAERLIDAVALSESIRTDFYEHYTKYHDSDQMALIEMVDYDISEAPTIDAVRVVRCHQCTHSEPLESNCELNTGTYLHCTLWRGDEVRYVWHKYKKYYRDYSIVERDGYCDSGEPMEWD